MPSRCVVPRALERRPSWPILATAILILSAQPVEAADATKVSDASSAQRAERIVSLNPSLTSILLALNARDHLVGIDDFSAQQRPELAQLPRVGGLFNPSLEAVVALEPDLVVLVPSVEQRDFRSRLDELGIAVAVFDNIHFDQVLENIERLGRVVGRERQARERIAAIQRVRNEVSRRAAKRPRPRALLVLQRDPIFIAGRGSFLDEMLEAAGAENIGRSLNAPYPRVAAEWLVAAAPQVILDISPDVGDPLLFWSRWPALPAVINERVVRLDPESVTLPGPYLDRSLEILSDALHGARVGGGASVESVTPSHRLGAR